MSKAKRALTPHTFNADAKYAVEGQPTSGHFACVVEQPQRCKLLLQKWLTCSYCMKSAIANPCVLREVTNIFSDMQD